MKLNELVCPDCGLKCLTSCSYTTCASCGRTFYASESRRDPPPAYPYPIIVYPQPVTYLPHWHCDSPYRVTVTTDGTTATTSAASVGQSGVTAWN